MTLTRVLVPMAVLLLLAPVALGDNPKEGAGKYPFVVTVRGKGTPMILIPGLACSGAVWNDTVKRFDQKFECHVLTLAGFAGVPPQEGPFLVPVRDGIVRYIREKKLDRPVIVGHSIGGFLAYDLGITAPDFVGPLVVVDGLPFLPALMDEKTTEAQMKQAAPAFAKRMAEAKKEDYIRQQEATLALWIDDKAKRDLALKWGADSNQATVGKAMAEMMSRDLRDDVAKIKAPVLLVAAPVAFGVVTKEEARKRYLAQVEKISDKKVAVAAKSKHFVMIDEPEWLWQQVEEFAAANRK